MSAVIELPAALISAHPLIKNLRPKKQIFLVVMPKKKRPEYERKLKLIRQRILAPSDVAKRLRKKSKK